MDYFWAEPYPELHKILTSFQLTEVASPIRYCYKTTQSILQVGPQCGLVALAMCMNHNKASTVDTIFEYAKTQNYTYNGELLSIQYMYNLAKQFLEDCKIDIYEGNLNSRNIQDFLLAGGLILVPYPSQFKFHYICRLFHP